MDNVQPTAEELAAEQVATQVPKEEEIKASIIEEYGFDAEADVERIDKLVAKEIDNRTKLSAAIGQKIKHREAAAELAKKIPPSEKKPDAVVPSKDELTPKDVYALMNAKVAEEDIEQVADYAKFKKISVAEALKLTVVKTMLEESAEQRTTANATQTRGGARGTSQVKGEDILSKAEKTGELPESEEDIQKLFLARQARRKN